MTAHVRVFRAVSATLAAALVAGAMLMTGAGAMALEPQAPVAQQQLAAPVASEPLEATPQDDQVPADAPVADKAPADEPVADAGEDATPVETPDDTGNENSESATGGAPGTPNEDVSGEADPEAPAQEPETEGAAAADPQANDAALEAEEQEAPTATSTTLKSSVEKTTLGLPVTLTATISPNVAGNVEFFDGDESIATVKQSRGTASTLITDLALGKHEMTAVFTPTNVAKYAQSTSDAVSVTVDPKPAPVAEKTPVTGATLTWGVKESFRNYINVPMFEGQLATLGAAKQQPAGTGVFTWPNGVGHVVATTNPFKASTADVTYGKNDGAHFQLHPLKVNGAEVYALDLQFTKPRVVVTSASTGELRMDVKGRNFVSMTEVGSEFSYTDQLIAVLDLPAQPAVDEGTKTVTWSDANATLTKEGEQAFGSFYVAGTALDPVTFSLPLDYDGEIIGADRTATSTKLTASRTEITEGESVTLTATVAPTVAGKVTFRVPSAGVEKTVAVKNGKASLKLSKLSALIHTARATFTPENDNDYAHSTSAPLEIVVAEATTKKPQDEGTLDPTGAQAAGSLNWGISSFFAAYTTAKSGTAACPTAGGHCANGEIATSGVGAGWQFPQAAGGSWDVASQTGTVQFSGVVTFRGYGQTMYQVANPSITVTGPTTATLNTGYAGGYGPSSVALNLGAASKSVGANGEVTWSGVPVSGGLTGINAGQDSNFDALTFTVGAPSGVSYGSTAVKNERSTYKAAESAPATAGVRVLTDPKKITAGGRIELEAEGFDASDEGVLVVLYDGNGNNPVVLDDEVTASTTGLVTWAGTLPKDISKEHIITVQGSTNAGAVIDITTKKKVAKKAKSSEVIVDAPSADQVRTAGVLGHDVTATGGMAVWEWWASAGGLVVIAACMSLLVVRQRKNAAS